MGNYRKGSSCEEEEEKEGKEKVEEKGRRDNSMKEESNVDGMVLREHEQKKTVERERDITERKGDRMRMSEQG